MSMKVPDVGLSQLLTVLITNELSGSKLHLYSNNYTPVAGTTLANLTECVFVGYSSVSLSSWSSPASDGMGHYYTTAAVATYTPSTSAGSGNIYGYYLTDSTGTYLLGAELFAGGPLVLPQSVPLNLTLTVTDKSEF